jgi:hypothetical protein
LEIFRLLGPLGAQIHLPKLGHPVDQLSHVRAELPLNIIERGLGVLDRVVQEPRADRRHIKAQVGQQQRDLDGVPVIGRAGVARLALMGVAREA